MTTQTSHFRKTLPAYAAALGMTAVIALCILAFGLNALLNHNTVPVQAVAPQDAAALSGSESTQQLQDLQTQISAYQARETQYQTQLQQAADQINLLNQQKQQYQNLINSLQQAGVIQINPDGRVSLNRNFSSGGD
jgi:flagellar motor protein MotB